jgi:hypothetical protein
MSNLTETLFGVTVPAQSIHSPGPWETHLCPVRERAKYDRQKLVPAIVGIITDSRGYIADVWFRDSWEQSDANAHLIAAAPDLLKALKGLVGAGNYCHLFGDGIDCDCAYCVAKKAIAKAEEA